MSWLDRVQKDMRITTGDGRQWAKKEGLAWMNAAYSQEYLYAEHNWIDVDGSYIDRKKSLGTRYKIELHFQGANHIETARSFWASTKDNRPWLIEHPLYDLLTVQPTSLEFDNGDDKLNTTKITGTVIETLQDAPFNFLKTTPDDVPEMFKQVAESAEVAVTEIPDATDINRMAADNTKAYKKGLPIITDAIDYSSYTNAFNTASTYINTATATPLFAMRAAISAMQLPGQFKASVDNRLKVLFSTFDDLRANIFGLITVAAKQIFSVQQAACLSGMCIAAATPIKGDYLTKDQVFDKINQLSGKFSQFVEDLDSLQGAVIGNPTSFVADDTMMHDLSQLVNITLGNLYIIALGAKQERIFTCDRSTNVILLAHRFLGLQADDKTIDELIDINNISFAELLEVQKGRKITYYV